jgi:hypothetical protein
VEVRTTQRLPPAMRTAFNVAAVTMAFTDGRAAIGAWLELLAQWLLSAGKWHFTYLARLLMLYLP